MYKYVTKWRAALLVFLTHQMALPILRYLRRPEKFLYTDDKLRSMAPGVLGRDLIDMLDQRRLQLLPYYVKHDIKHIVLGYDTTEAGEVCLQCFMLGNGHLSFPVAATVLYGFFTMPEHWPRFLKSWRRGRKSNSISGWNWSALIELPTRSLSECIAPGE